MKIHLGLRLLPVCLGLVLASARAELVHLDLLASDAVNQRIGFYVPLPIRLSEKRPAAVKREPADLKAPLYGVMKVGPSDWPNAFALILDDPADGPMRIFFDANGNGDVTDDVVPAWKPVTRDGVLQSYVTEVDPLVNYGKEPVRLHLRLYRFPRNSPNYEQRKTVMFYYADYARVGSVTLEGKTYPVTLIDGKGSGDFRNMDSEGGERRSPTSMATPNTQLFIDTTGAGKSLRMVGKEWVTLPCFPANLPFQVDGKTYAIRHLTAAGDSFELIPAPAELISPSQIKYFVQMAKGSDGHDYKLPALLAGFFGLTPDATYRSMSFTDDYDNTTVQLVVLPDGYLLARSLVQKAYPVRFLRVGADFALQIAVNWDEKNPPVAIPAERAVKLHYIDVGIWSRIAEETSETK